MRVRNVMLWIAVGAQVSALQAPIHAQQVSASVSVIQTVTVRGGAKGEIDYSNGTITVRGRGVPLKGSTEGQRELTAEKAAMAEAYAALAAVAAGVHVTSSIDVHNTALEDERVKVEIKAYIQNAVPVEGKGGWNEQKGIYEVYMTMPIYGPNSLFATLGTAKLEELQKQDSESKVKPILVPKPAPSPAGQEGPFTGVIIDARGLGMKGCMSPQIKRADGTVVWGKLEFANHEEAVAVAEVQGIVGWLRSLEAAKINPRAGSNPLIIKAIGKQGAFEGNAVVSDEDAEVILRANAESHFLDKLNVIFVI